MFNQKDYILSESKLENSKIVSMLYYLKDNYSEKSPLNIDLINNTLNEIENQFNDGLSPQAYNCIILVLLSYVPKEIKEY